MAFFRLLLALAKLSAISAGILLTAITAVVCASLIGRNTTGWTLVGDFELSGAAAGAAIALFIPWCQATRGHIIVDFVTTRCQPRTNAQLDRFGALVMAVVMALMAWRSSIGLMNAWNTQAGTMMLGFPEWIVYACIVPPLALSALLALVQAVHGLDAFDRVQPKLATGAQG
jgi:TRAP-type C4-dicarboxylate transport system permease small subunit